MKKVNPMLHALCQTEGGFAMKRFLLGLLCFVFLAMFFLAPAFAAPWLICDPQAGVTHYKLTGPAWVTGTIMAETDGSIKMDVSAAIIGNNLLTVAACKDDPTWGEMCSNAVPFDFARPGAPSNPINLKLSP